MLIKQTSIPDIIINNLNNDEIIFSNEKVRWWFTLCPLSSRLEQLQKSNILFPILKKIKINEIANDNAFCDFYFQSSKNSPIDYQFGDITLDELELLIKINQNIILD